MYYPPITLETILAFGPYKGCQVEDLIEDYPQYIVHLYEKEYNFGADTIECLLIKRLI